MGLLEWQAHEGGPFPTVAAGFSLTATSARSGGSVTKLCTGPGLTPGLGVVTLPDLRVTAPPGRGGLPRDEVDRWPMRPFVRL
jgi:hypothetical protein